MCDPVTEAPLPPSLLNHPQQELDFPWGVLLEAPSSPWPPTKAIGLSSRDLPVPHSACPSLLPISKHPLRTLPLRPNPVVPTFLLTGVGEPHTSADPGLELCCGFLSTLLGTLDLGLALLLSGQWDL